MSHQLDGAQQFKATFNEVKVELAAHVVEQLQPAPSGRLRTLSMGTRLHTKLPSRPSIVGSSLWSEDMQHSTAPLSRHETIISRVETLNSQIARTQHQLDSELRIARNLAILTPFQCATRNRVQIAIAPLAKKVRAMRIELTKLSCYRFVLLTDLADEERQWEQAKHDALRAATQKLSMTEHPTGPFQVEDDESLKPIHRLRADLSATVSFALSAK